MKNRFVLPGLMLVVQVFGQEVGVGEKTFLLRHLTPHGVVQQEYRKDELIVQQKPGTPSPYVAANKIGQTIAASLVREVRMLQNEAKLLRAVPGADPDFDAVVKKFGYDRFLVLSLAGGMDAQQIQNLAWELARDPTVESVTLSPVFKHQYAFPNDTFAKFQWNLLNVGQTSSGFGLPAGTEVQAKAGADIKWIDAMHKITPIPAGVKSHVYVLGIDTGASPSQSEDLDPEKFFFSYNVITDSALPEDQLDDNGHGLHTLGTVCASTNNGVGIAGIASFANCGSIKVLDEDGRGSIADVNQGILIAAKLARELKAKDPKARLVVNMSLGAFGMYSSMQAAVDIAFDAGVIIVAAAGNDGVNIDQVAFSPASLRHVIAVAASTATDERAWYSNWGPEKVVVWAPGDYVLSLSPRYSPDPAKRRTQENKLFSENGYRYLRGTSMASPHVTGAVTLILEVLPDLTFAQIRIRLMNVDAIGATLRDPETRHVYTGTELVKSGGRLNAAAILEEDLVSPARPQIKVAFAGHSAIGLEISGSGDDGSAGRLFGVILHYGTMPFDPRFPEKTPQVRTIEHLPYTGVQTDGGGNVEYLLRNAAFGPNVPLRFGTQYYIAARVWDDAGNISEPSELVSATTVMPATHTAYKFSDGDGRSLVGRSGPMAPYFQLMRGINHVPWYRAYLPDGSGMVWRAGKEGSPNYTGIFGDAELVSPEIDLTHIRGSVSLSFETYVHMLSLRLLNFDMAEVQVLEVDGDVTVKRTLLREFLPNSRGFPFLFDAYYMDMSEFRGKRIKLAFRFFADSASDGLGFLVRNVVVYADTAWSRPSRNRH